LRARPIAGTSRAGVAEADAPRPIVCSDAASEVWYRPEPAYRHGVGAISPGACHDTSSTVVQPVHRIAHGDRRSSASPSRRGSRQADRDHRNGHDCSGYSGSWCPVCGPASSLPLLVHGLEANEAGVCGALGGSVESKALRSVTAPAPARRGRQCASRVGRRGYRSTSVHDLYGSGASRNLPQKLLRADAATAASDGSYRHHRNSEGQTTVGGSVIMVISPLILCNFF
jgi:hypothetical protein